MDATEGKLLSLFLLLGISLIIGCIPLFFRSIFRRKRIQTILDYSSCLAAGIFIGTGLLHLLPEIDEKFVDYYASLDGGKPDYPYMYLCIGIGFLVVFLLEHSIVACRTKTTLVGGHEHAAAAAAAGECDSERKSSDGDDATPIDPTFKEILLFTVMYLHAIFEGLALGLLDEVSDILGLLLAVTIHKSVILATLVVQLVTKNVKTSKSLLLVIIFSVVAPAGIVIGIVMDVTGSRETEGGVLATGIMSAFATGTLFFVVFMEILPEGFRSGKSPFFRALVVVGGFVLIALLSIIPEHHHHEHESHGACGNNTAGLLAGNSTDHDDHDH